MLIFSDPQFLARVVCNVSIRDQGWPEHWSRSKPSSAFGCEKRAWGLVGHPAEDSLSPGNSL